MYIITDTVVWSDKYIHCLSTNMSVIPIQNRLEPSIKYTKAPQTVHNTPVMKY